MFPPLNEERKETLRWLLLIVFLCGAAWVVRWMS